MIRIRQIKIDIKKDSNEYLKNKVASILEVDVSSIEEIELKKRSIDARHKEKIYFIYEVDVLIKNELDVIKHNSSKDIFLTPKEEYIMPKCGNIHLNTRPVIIGSGPAGLFAAYLLAEDGYKPLIIERGEKIEDRVNTVDHFWSSGELNINSNVQFGEGGAGTFSDGKLNTLTGDKNFRMKKVFKTFVENDANHDILYDNKPHIGTDVLRNVIVNIRNQIIKMGGEFRYNTLLTDICVKDNKIESIILNNEEKLNCDVLVLALGHSARDTFEMLLKRNLSISSKPFAVGIRIEHPQAMIDFSQYGESAKYLPHASYKLTYNTNSKRGVYSFCMCPGGYVVNASSEDKGLAINGMSNHKRDTNNANSAFVETVSEKDYGSNILDGIKFQRNIEKKAYDMGEGKIPIQLLDDYINNKKTTALGSVDAIFKGEYSFSNINDILPSYINDAIKEALLSFDKKIKGFMLKDAIIAGVETRTSSPIRINRDEYLESNIKGIYPCGEGAGYAGGITTSAMDGIKVSEAIIEKYEVYNEK